MCASCLVVSEALQYPYNGEEPREDACDVNSAVAAGDAHAPHVDARGGFKHVDKILIVGSIEVKPKSNWLRSS